MSEADQPDFSVLEERIGYHFTDRDLLTRALTHPSWSQIYPEDEHYQRLEFLGDSVLSLVLAEKLYALFPHKREGVLTRNRAALAKGAQLATLAKELTLDEHLRLSEAEFRNGGRMRESILEDTVESVIGAIYLDGGMAAARDVILSWYGDLKERLQDLLHLHNPKGQLQERIQPQLGNDAIRYVVLEESGPPHSRQFRVCVEISGKNAGEGSGTSKKEAEENAAREALLGLPEEPEDES